MQPQSKLVDTPDRLARFVTRYKTPCIVFAAVEVGVFALLSEGPKTAAAAAEALDLEPRGTAILLDCLVGIGTLAMQEGGYSLAPALCEAMADRHGPFSRGLLSYKDQNAAWLELSTLLAGGAPGARFYDRIQTPELVAPYLSDVRAANAGAAAALASSLAATEKPRRVLDIGSGHGAYVDELIGRFPSTSFDAFDLPHAIEVTRKALAEHVPDGRLRFLCGDALTFRFEEGYDLVMLNDILHYFQHDARRSLIRRAFDALAPGGLLVVSKLAKGDEAAPGSVMSLLSMRFYINAHGGYLDSDSDCAEMLRSVCGVEPEIVEFDDFKTVLLTRRTDEAAPRSGARKAAERALAA